MNWTNSKMSKTYGRYDYRSYPGYFCRAYHENWVLDFVNSLNWNSLKLDKLFYEIKKKLNSLRKISKNLYIIISFRRAMVLSSTKKHIRTVNSKSWFEALYLLFCLNTSSYKTAQVICYIYFMLIFPRLCILYHYMFQNCLCMGLEKFKREEEQVSARTDCGKKYTQCLFLTNHWQIYSLYIHGWQINVSQPICCLLK